MEGNCSRRPARLKGGPNSVASDISTVAYRIYLDFILIWNVFDLAESTWQAMFVFEGGRLMNHE